MHGQKQQAQHVQKLDGSSAKDEIKGIFIRVSNTGKQVRREAPVIQAVTCL